MDFKPKKSIREYLEDTQHFLIPAYQRGYKWGVSTSRGMSDAKTLILDLLEAFNQTPRREYFIQGVTGYNNEDTFYLIDGQQRTTTLFLIVAILADYNLRQSLLFKEGKLKLEYFGSRGKTADFLEQFCMNGNVDKPEDTQDIHFLCKAIKEIQESLPKEEQHKQDFFAYILDYVFLFQVEVSKKEAPNVFSMMNGNKADMKIGELIKAEYLSGLSRMEIIQHPYSTENVQETLSILTSQIQEETATEWKINTSRSRFAREWDKWTYWWQQAEIRTFFRVYQSDVTGWLFPIYCQRNKIPYTTDVAERRAVFKNYSAEALTRESLKPSFESLRRIQKRLEDLYDHHYTYNRLGFVLSILEANQRIQALDYFIQQTDNNKLHQYTILRMAWISHENALARIENIETEDQAKETSESIKRFVSLFSGDIYNVDDAKEAAMRYLYFCNITAADDRKTKFEFFYSENSQYKYYWTYRSLEHIWPKSKVSDTETAGKVLRSAMDKEGVSEHMLGNMAFLHKTDNSKFNALSPNEKRQIYFDLEEKIYSRAMLHTMAAFGGKEWNDDLSQIPSIIQSRHTDEIVKLNKLYE